MANQNVDTCPNCSRGLNPGSGYCPACGWEKGVRDGRVNGMVGCLAMMLGILFVTGSCAYQSYSDKSGDVYGFGYMAVVESGIVLATMAWLGAGLAFGSKAPKERKFAVARSMAGILL